MTDAKPRLPKELKPLADAAEERLNAQPYVPLILIERMSNGGWQFTSPYSDKDDASWLALLHDALGTRDPLVVEHFLSVFTKLCGNSSWDEDRQAWRINESDFYAVIGIVAALAPADAAQAAHSAQLAALHMITVKLSAVALEWYSPDARTVATINRTVRAYGEGMERLARLQGKIQPRQVNQTIQVFYYDQRDQRSVNVNNGGCGSNGGQCQTQVARMVDARAALPSSCSDDRQTVPGSGDERQEDVPHAR